MISLLYIFLSVHLCQSVEKLYETRSSAKLFLKTCIMFFQSSPNVEKGTEHLEDYFPDVITWGWNDLNDDKHYYICTLLNRIN